MSNIADLFKAETEIEIKAGELFGIMREATKAEFLMNAVQCEVPYKHIREMATGEKEAAAGEGDPVVMEAAIEIHASEVAKAIKKTILQNAVRQQGEPDEELPFPDPEYEKTGVVSGAEKYFTEAEEGGSEE